MELRSRRARRPAKPFQPAPGKEFELDPVPSIEARTKGFFVRISVLAGLSALAITGCFGLYFGNFGPIQSVWVVVGPIVGAMINHYFGSPRKDAG